MSKRALARLGLIRNVRSQSSDAAPPVVTAIAGKPSAKAMEQQYESTDDDYAWDLENLPEFDGHDFTSRAHDQLTAQRIFREYYRKMAYELPQLSKFARPFTPPTVKQPLQFRYQTYCGESHPVEKKVAVLVNVDALGLSEKEVRKLVLLSGPRFDAHSRRLKMSHEGFPNANQNKKYLCDQLDKLIAEAKNTSDTFEDIPLDTRHVKSKTRRKFPIEWVPEPHRERARADWNYRRPYWSNNTPSALTDKFSSM